MDELSTVDELQTSTVQGEKGKLPALDGETMDAILCKLNCLQLMYKYAATILYITVGFTMGKAEEWNNPVSEEALVRQGNDKCYQHRKPGLKKTNFYIIL